MFGIGLPEMIVIAAVALIVVGPEKLPEFAKSLAKTLSELKKSVEGFKADLNESLNDKDGPKQIINDLKPDLEEAAKTLQQQLQDLPSSTLEQIPYNQNGVNGHHSPAKKPESQQDHETQNSGKASLCEEVQINPVSDSSEKIDQQKEESDSKDQNGQP